ncbi:MAG: carbohydrate kinase family protein [Caldilineaceae bacterium]|nr:carbohydrate kinase family protein [Caldilineaceae bacterium]
MTIVVTGSIAYDYLMSFPGRFTEHILPEKLQSISLSFLVDSMVRQRGGVAANIAYTMKLLGADPLILGTVGQDFGDYRRWLEEHGLRTDQIIEIPDEFTASFFVSTDLDQNQIANFYTGAMAHARSVSLAARGLTHARIVIISPNDPQAMLNYANECRTLGIPFAYDPSQQIARLSGEDLRQSIPGAAFLMVNEYEAAIAQEKTDWTLDQIRGQVETLVITEGKQGSAIYRGDETIRIPVATPHRIAEPTGAGDGYRGGFFAAWSAGLPLDICGRVGALCSTYVLEQVGTSSHRFSLTDFIARYEENFGAEPRLAALG